ncbi:MAG: 1-acyl-sn-glycerol-3-phosphate acyltransferase [Desulfuromonas sp.]|nr:MAG: 1-acyl-sn-glycerol-3-phosphate acyltransferase [Desulfuromonas sp.]
MTTLRTTIFWAGLIPWTLFVIITGTPLSLINPDWMHNYCRIWARLLLVLAGVRLSVKGREHLPQGEPLIFMPNHQSTFDILALFIALPVQFRWIAKEELFHIPFFGFAMRRAGYISIDRGDRKKAIKSMDVAAQRIAAGTSVIIFPEGTRSEDGKLLPLKKGGFVLALKSGVSILPMAIEGSCKVNPKHSLRLYGGEIHVTLQPAIPTADLPMSERDRLMEEVRTSLASVLGPPAKESR